jgi:NAD(P)-dependent dehydrogenase (short-subunit alcohol dehydrogenase family)
MKTLKNKKAVITGGSRGIGKAIAAEYLKNGAEVFLIARKRDELIATQKELSSLGVVTIAIADVSKQEDMERVAAQVGEQWGAINILVTAAGIYGPIGPITDIDPIKWREAIEVNLFGVFLAVHSFVPLMKDAANGSIINFVGGGEGAYANFSSYVSAKGGIARFTETAAAELKDKNIRVNAIAPGAVNTKFLDDVLAAGPEKAGAAYEKSVKQKESGGVSPEKAAALALFLASDESKGLSGKIFSAMWDQYKDFPARLDKIMSSDSYTMRRVTPEEK